MAVLQLKNDASPEINAEDPAMHVPSRLELLFCLFCIIWNMLHVKPIV